jgi:LDH2 family malate/lactate/ureidoglycolate dehydrogenase
MRGLHMTAVQADNGVQRISIAAMTEWMSRVFLSCGLDERSSVCAAQVLVRTSARGVDTHGVARLPVYVDKLRSGELKARPQVHFEDRCGVLHVHADCGLGQVVASDAVDQAVARAASNAFVPVVMHDIGHMAAIGMFALRAAEAGMLAYVVQSAPPMMALPGFRGAAIGNNPLAFASPVSGGPPLVFDIAMSFVARGNVLAAARDGRAIPDDWALDAEGRVTTDPHAALMGAMLPLAGHKGMGLAMMVQCLAGSLSGAEPPPVTGATPGSAPSRVGAFMFLANPELVAGRDAYDRHLHQWLETYKSSAGEQGRYPGEGADRTERQRQISGVPIPPALLKQLEAVGDAADAPFSQVPRS